MEKRNRQRIRELTHNIETVKEILVERENEIYEIIIPYIRNVDGGTDEDVAKLVEIRQTMLTIRGDHMFRQVEDTLKGKDTNIDHVEGWVGKEIIDNLRFAVNQYDCRKRVLSDHEDKLMRYVRQYLNRRGGNGNLEMINELIRMLPDCMARYNLMASREYLYKLGI